MTYKDNKPSKLFKAKEGYDKYASFYDKKSDFLDGFEKGILQKIIGDIQGKQVLDIGCVTGRCIKNLIDKGSFVTGCDISLEMLKIARKKFHNVNFVEGDIENLPFKDNSFDVVVASFVIVHLKNLQKAFDEVYRVLKTGGIFVLTNINQKKAPKLVTESREKIVIISYYHIPEHVISALKDSFFGIESDEFIYENGIWINQVVKAIKR